MKFEIDIPKELISEMESYAKVEEIPLKGFILFALGEKVGELRERLGVKNLTQINLHQTPEKSLTEIAIPKPGDEHSLLTATDVVKYLKLSRSGVYHLMKSGEIPVVKIGRSVRIRREDLENFIQKTRIGE